MISIELFIFMFIVIVVQVALGYRLFSIVERNGHDKDMLIARLELRLMIDDVAKEMFEDRSWLDAHILYRKIERVDPVSAKIMQAYYDQRMSEKNS